MTDADIAYKRGYSKGYAAGWIGSKSGTCYGTLGGKDKRGRRALLKLAKALVKELESK